jgi:hypothetical protein
VGAIIKWPLAFAQPMFFGFAPRVIQDGLAGRKQAPNAVSDVMK